MNVKEKFNELLRAGIIPSLNFAALQMGISSSRLSQFLKNSYKGNIKETEESVKSYIQLIEERLQSDFNDSAFVNTYNATGILNLSHLVHIQKTIGVITGRAGLGKTIALQKYAGMHKDVIYIEVDTAYSSKELLKELHKVLGGNGKGHLNGLKMEIIGRLKGSGRLIIIDQAEYLPDKCLDLLRSIHDKAKIGLILAGLPRLEWNIRGADGIHEQIYTRVGVAFKLMDLSDQDIEKMVQSVIPSKQCNFKDFIEPSKRNARVLYTLIRESKRIAKNERCDINQKTIGKAKSILIG